MSNQTELHTLEVTGTNLHTLSTTDIPKLVNLSINNSNIAYIDLCYNYTLEKLVFGVNQKFKVWA